jgi:hypothetical protein
MSKKKENRIWVQRNGRKIPISEMSNSHILNSIKMFENSEFREKEVKWLREELDRRYERKKEENASVENRYEILDL